MVWQWIDEIPLAIWRRWKIDIALKLSEMWLGSDCSLVEKYVKIAMKKKRNRSWKCYVGLYWLKESAENGVHSDVSSITLRVSLDDRWNDFGPWSFLSP